MEYRESFFSTFIYIWIWKLTKQSNWFMFNIIHLWKGCRIPRNSGQNLRPRIFPNLCLAVAPAFLGRFLSFEKSVSRIFDTLGLGGNFCIPPDFFSFTWIFRFSEAIFRPFSITTFLAESLIGLSILDALLDILIFGFHASSFWRGISSSSEASAISSLFSFCKKHKEPLNVQCALHALHHFTVKVHCQGKPISTLYQLLSKWQFPLLCCDVGHATPAKNIPAYLEPGKYSPHPRGLCSSSCQRLFWPDLQPSSSGRLSQPAWDVISCSD